MSNNISSYQQTLDDLEFRRARSLDELRRIEAAMTGLRAAMEISVHMTPGPNSAIATPAEIRHEAQQRYSEMSVRWAVLKFLAEHSLQPQKTADISSALLEGGNPKASKATVSAVVSAMNKKNEVMLDPEAQGYKLTVVGRSVWGAIVNSSRYLNRGSSPTENEHPD